MPSSTWRPASSDRWRLIALWTAVVGSPIVWLVLLQTNYVLAYPACRERTNATLLGAAGATLLVVSALAIAAWRWRRRDTDPPARLFLGVLGVLLSALFVVLVLGMAVPPMILNSCD